MTVTQSQFRAGLFNPDLPAPEGLTNPDGAQASKRFDVYRNNMAVGLADALENAFPVVQKLVGDEFFRAMAGVYLRAQPPRSPLMMFYGEKMPMFLERFEPAQSLPYLPDIARLELAMRHAYHAADAAPISGDDLAAIPADDLMATRFTLAPAVQILRSNHPVHGIYRVNTTPDAPRPVQGAECVLITRPAYDPVPHLITAQTADFLEALGKGQPLGVAMSLAGTGLDLGAILGLLLSQNAITELKGPSP